MMTNKHFSTKGSLEFFFFFFKIGSLGQNHTYLSHILRSINVLCSETKKSTISVIV